MYPNKRGYDITIIPAEATVCIGVDGEGLVVAYSNFNTGRLLRSWTRKNENSPITR
jgi:hypothetical protein